MVDNQLNTLDIGMIKAALGGGFTNTTELKLMKYQDAMATDDAPAQKKAVIEEYDRLQEHKVFTLIKRCDVLDNAKILTSTWAMKKKSNGTFCARINGKRYEQVDGEHFDQDNLAALTIDIVSVREMLVLMLLMKGYAYLVDVNRAFLLGGFKHDVITNQKPKIYLVNQYDKRNSINF